MCVEGCGRLTVHDSLLEVAWFCMCKLGGSLAGKMNVVGWLVQVRVRWETEGFVLKLSGACHQHALHQVDTYVCLRMT